MGKRSFWCSNRFLDVFVYKKKFSVLHHCEIFKDVFIFGLD